MTSTFVNSQSTEAAKIIFQLPGRVRFEVKGLYRSDELARFLANEFCSVPGTLQAGANILTGRLLIQFDAKKTSLDLITKALTEILSRPKSSRKNRNAWLKGKPRLDGTAWESLTSKEALSHLRSNLKTGLSPKLITERFKIYGPNRLPLLRGRTHATILKQQLNNLPTLFLIGAAVFSFFTGGLADGAIILLVIAANAGIGYRMESSAEKIIRSIAPVDPTPLHVLRKGETTLLPPSQLVPGDVIELNQGLVIPVDARLISVQDLYVDESILTGESVPVQKTAKALGSTNLPLGDRKNMVFSGTAVVGGWARAVVVRTGAQTEAGQIQKLSAQSLQPETPLQIQLRELGNQMIWVSMAASFGVALVGLWRGYRLGQVLKTSASLAIAAIPESLPTIATTTLAQGVQRLRNEGILVRRLDALETLGGVDILCFDKTGTLTHNQISVTQIITPARNLSVRDDGFFEGGKKLNLRQAPSLRELIHIVTLCNEAPYEPHNRHSELGSSTERALLRLAKIAGFQASRIRSSSKKISTRYRTENRLYMTTVHIEKEDQLMATKGSPEQILQLCSSYAYNGHVHRLTDEARKRFLADNDRMAAEGLRVLGVCYKRVAKKSKPKEADMIWLGLVGMQDPLRDGLSLSMQQFHQAGIRTVMITGDQKATAHSVGRSLQLNSDEPLKIVESHELGEDQDLSRIDIFARVSPADKLNIVRRLQQNGKLVAMIGDGLNDGPALKAAHIGIAMGGAQNIPHSAADIVLLEDQIDKIYDLLQEGRRVQADIKKAVDYILVQNTAEVLFTFLSVALGLGEPLTPMQFLWMNLVTDIFPELALAQDPAETGCMNRPPVHAATRLWEKHQLRRMGFDASVLALSALGSYAWSCRERGPCRESKTIGFTSLIGGSLLYTFGARSPQPFSTHQKYLGPNHLIPLAVGAGFVAEVLAVTVPSLRKLLSTTRVGPGDVLLTGLSCVLPQILVEGAKRYSLIQKEKQTWVHSF